MKTKIPPISQVRMKFKFSATRKGFCLFLVLFSLNACFSVRIDAQIVLLAKDDCYVYIAGPKANDPYGLIDPDSLKTRKSVASEEFTRETYLKFQIGLPDTTFSLAVVKMYGQVLETKTCQIYFTDTTWQEAALTGNTRPPGTYIGGKAVEAGEGYYDWDVTGYINQAVSEGREYIAFIIKDVAGAASTKDTRWHSKENSSGNQPLLELTEGEPAFHRVGVYYVDNLSGNDENTAASPGQAWKSLQKINATVFRPGDTILFKSGGTWQGGLNLKGSGSEGIPILVGKYGDGPNPVFEGLGLVQNTVQLLNQQYIEVQDLYISNFGDAVDFRRAMYIQAEDMGAVRHIILRRLEIADVNGVIDDETSKNNGGIFLEITGSAIPTYFDTLVIEDCYIHDVDRTGISNRSTWSDRTVSTDGDWTPTTNMIIRNNTFERTGANALIVRVAFKPLIEYNLFNNCSIKGSGNACFSFNTNYALFQYNEACYTHYNSGDEDAGGFDSDYNSKFTTIQYNYSHDNGFGGVLLTGGPGDGFNDGTTIRYNVLANNADHVIRTSGGATNSLVYNNTIYSKPELENISLVWHKSWEGYSSNTKYYNNIFQVMGPGASVSLGSSTGNVFDYNIFFGSQVSGEPDDQHKINLDPLLESPGLPGTMDSLYGFRLKAGSPAVNSGFSVPGFPGKDFDGNPLPAHDIIDRGAFEFMGPTGIFEPVYQRNVRIYPNPASELVTIEIDDFFFPGVLVSLYNVDNRLIFLDYFSVSGNDLNFSLQLRSYSLPPGSYILKLAAGSHFIHEAILILQ